MRLFQEDEWENCMTVKKFDVEDVLHYAWESGKRKGCASHGRRSIYRRRREPRATTRGNGAFVRENGIGSLARSRECWLSLPPACGSLTWRLSYRVIKLYGRQQLCRKCRGACFFCVGDAFRIEMVYQFYARTAFSAFRRDYDCEECKFHRFYFTFSITWKIFGYSMNLCNR